MPYPGPRVRINPKTFAITVVTSTPLHRPTHYNREANNPTRKTTPTTPRPHNLRKPSRHHPHASKSRTMLLTSTLALLALAAQPAKSTQHIPVSKLNDIATILAH